MNEAAFKAHVLRWLREEQDLDAASVETVSGDGSDWQGSTEGGFYSTFTVEIHYRDSTGKLHMTDITGEDMGSLWRWVVDSWTAEAPATEATT